MTCYRWKSTVLPGKLFFPKKLFFCVCLEKKVFVAKRSSFTNSMSHIFWKLLILAINEVFLSILGGVRILLTHCNRIEHKIWHLVISRLIVLFMLVLVLVITRMVPILMLMLVSRVVVRHKCDLYFQFEVVYIFEVILFYMSTCFDKNNPLCLLQFKFAN